jgi:hypothetical protein
MNQRWTNRPVVDEHHERIGKVTDVLYGEGDQPTWATVKTGLLAERLAPLDRAYLTEDGTVVLPYDRGTIAHAPNAPRDHVLTPDVREEVTDYFGQD